MLPAAWITLAICAGVAVAAYNYLASRFSLPILLTAGSALNAGTLMVLELLRGANWPGSTFVMYVWKDVYIVVMLEMVWSWAHVVIRATTARWVFGWFCAAGSVGSIAGNITVGMLAKHIGTGASILWALPLFGLIVWIVSWPASRAVQHRFAEAKHNPRALDVRPSAAHYLMLILALVVAVQVVITWVDFLYNQSLELHYPSLDARTRVSGQVYALIDGLALVLQLSTGGLIRMLGLRVMLLAIPSIGGAAVAACLLWPGFLSAASTKTLSKAMDYSLFKASKEMLYTPLTYGEKTRAKAIIDMFGYRSAKGGASLFLWLFVSSVTTPALGILIFLGMVAWWVLAYQLGRRRTLFDQ